MKYLNAHIAAVIKNLRHRTGLSQEMLAERCGLDRTYISGIERGTRNITIASLEKVIIALDFTIPEFLTEVINSYGIQME